MARLAIEEDLAVDADREAIAGGVRVDGSGEAPGEAVDGAIAAGVAQRKAEVQADRPAPIGVGGAGYGQNREDEERTANHTASIAVPCERNVDVLVAIQAGLP